MENCANPGETASSNATIALLRARAMRPRRRRFPDWRKPVIRHYSSLEGGFKPGRGQQPVVSASRTFGTHAKLGRVVSSVLEVKQHRDAEDHAYPGRGPGGQQDRDLGRQAEGEHDIRQEIQ